MLKSPLPDAFPNSIFLLSGTNIPSLAVIIPIESTFVTSSYVSVPPIDTLPVTFSELNVPSEVTFGCAAVCNVPAKVDAVTIPVTNALPTTCSLDVGFVDPIPTLPVALTVSYTHLTLPTKA